MISHANPSDNDVARWLAAKLTALGYTVWVDLQKLKGGETFWPQIEKVIRNDARLVILLLSKTSNISEGVLKEIRVSMVVERELGLSNFLVPCKVDDLSTGNINIELQGRIYVPFERWSAGLKHLIERLEEENLNKLKDPYQTPLLEQLLVDERLGLRFESAPYDVNRLRVLSEPEVIYSVDSSIDPQTNTLVSHSVFNSRRISLIAYEAKAKLFGHDKAVCLRREAFLASGSEALGIHPREARRVYVELLNSAFRSHLLNSGMAEYYLSRRNPVYYFNNVNFPSMKVSLKLPENRRPSYRHLWGRHKENFWHLGFEGMFLSNERMELSLLPHIIFTLDSSSQMLSEDPEVNKARQHSARRKIARSWWNDKWRGFYYAFLETLKNDGPNIRISVGNGDSILLDGQLLSYEAPVSHEAVGNIEIDDWDDDEGQE